MGARFRFRSDSEALLALVDAAYGGHAPHRFAGKGPAIEVALYLSPDRVGRASAPVASSAPLETEPLCASIDDRNYVLVWPSQRRARVVASADMLEWPYHLRYELIEFAVFILAARSQALVPLHAACVGHGGRGILLLGASGAGKSTFVLHGMLQGLEVLAEDAVFVRPEGLLATGVATFLHVHADALEGVDDDGARQWIAGSPVIRRRSGVEKFEVDLRKAPRPVRLAAAPLKVVGTVVLSGRRSPRSGASLVPAARDEVVSCLAAGQGYAMTQPGWRRFERDITRSAVYHLHRGRHPGSAVDAVRRLLG